MGIFGWSLPPGCGQLPDEYDEPVQPRCHCGAWVRWVADGHDMVKCQDEDYGPRKPREDDETVVWVKQIESPFDDGEPWWHWVRRWEERRPYAICKKCGAHVPLGD